MTPARTTAARLAVALAAAAGALLAGGAAAPAAPLAPPVASLAPPAAVAPAFSAEGAQPTAVTAPAPALDAAFGEDGLAALPAGAPDGSASALAATPDGGVVAAGRAAPGGGWWVAKLDRDGRPDAGFGVGDGVAEIAFDGTAGGEWDDGVHDVGVDAAGRIVVAGERGPSETRAVALARLLPDGALDPGFDGDGRMLLHFSPQARFSMHGALHVAPGGEIAVAGSWRSRTPSLDPHFESLVVLAPDGSVAQGPRVLMQLLMAHVADLAVAPDGRIAAAGDVFVGSLLSVRTAALDPAPGFADPWHADLSSGQEAENGLRDARFGADGGLLAVGFTTSLAEPWHYRGTTVAFGPGGEGPRTQEIAGPPGEDLWLDAVGRTGGGAVAVGAVGPPGAATRPVVVPLGADGLPDPARGGVQPVALPPSPSPRNVSAPAFTADGAVVQLVATRQEGAAWSQRIARVVLGAAAGGGEDPGRGPGEDPGRGPGEDPGRRPGEDPGRGPGEDPGRRPGEDPGRGPGQDPGRGPGQDPERGPGAGRRPSSGGPGGGGGARPAARVRFAALGRGAQPALRGTVSEPGAAVEVALARVDRGGRCRALTATAPRGGRSASAPRLGQLATAPRPGRSGPCRPARWLPARADGRGRWTLRLKLAPGRYRAWARAAPRAGRTARPLTRIVFTVR